MGLCLLDGLSHLLAANDVDLFTARSRQLTVLIPQSA